MEVFTDIPFEIDTDAVLSTLHMDPASDRAREIRDLVETLRPIVRPKAVCDVAYVENKQHDSVELGGVTFTSRVLRVNLDGVERVFPFVATCGREILQHASPDDLLLRYCVDTLMEQALRAAGRHVRQWVRETHALGQTSVMSPGSLEDWPLSQQAQLFSLFGRVDQLIGVELTDSLLMVPIKSVSGIVFPTEVRFESCQLCPREGCPGRRARYDPELWQRRYGKNPPTGGQEEQGRTHGPEQ